MADASTFDPTKHLTKVGSADYLEVKWRIVWLRTLHPDAAIDTQLMSHPTEPAAIFKATVIIPGGGKATGWGSETPADFGADRGKVVDASVKSVR